MFPFILEDLNEELNYIYENVKNSNESTLLYIVGDHGRYNKTHDGSNLYKIIKFQ